MDIRINTFRDVRQHDSLDVITTLCDYALYMPLGKAIQKLRIAAGLNQPELAKLCGWDSQSRISNYERGIREPKYADLKLIANALHISVPDLIALDPDLTMEEFSNLAESAQTIPGAEQEFSIALDKVTGNYVPSLIAHHPDDPLPDGAVLIKESEVIFKGGPGHDLAYEIVEDSEPATYRLSWFQKERLNPARCRRFKCGGESNEPFVFAGDSILVNLDEVNVRNGKVYAFWHEGEGRRMKKLFRKPDGSLILNSFNATYPDEVLTPSDVEEKITIIGRVRDKSGRGGL